MGEGVGVIVASSVPKHRCRGREWVSGMDVWSGRVGESVVETRGCVFASVLWIGREGGEVVG